MTVCCWVCDRGWVVPRTIFIDAPAGVVAVIAGPGGAALAPADVEPFGAVVLCTAEVVWVGAAPAGWVVPWGVYEVSVAGGAFEPVALGQADVFAYVEDYAAGGLAADLTTAGPDAAGWGVPDGVVGTEDFFYFLSLFGP